MVVTNSVVGIIIDVSLVALPIWVVRTNLKFSTKTLSVIGIFCVGIFAVTMGIVRLIWNLVTDFNEDLYVSPELFLRSAPSVVAIDVIYIY